MVRVSEGTGAKCKVVATACKDKETGCWRRPLVAWLETRAGVIEETWNRKRNIQDACVAQSLNVCLWLRS